MKQAVKYIGNNQSSQSDEEAIRQANNDSNAGWINTPALYKIRAFITTLQRSDKLYNAFRKSASKSIQSPNDTRWNSYYDCFESAIELKSAYSAFVLRYKQLEDCELTTSDWRVVEETVAFLRPFKEATKQCEGDYITLDKVQLHMDCLKAHLEQQRQVYSNNKAMLESIITC